MTIDLTKLGWPVAAALLGAMAFGSLSGFQANTAPKFAVVNIKKVFDQSKFRESNSKILEDARQARANAFNFIIANQAMNNGDATKYAGLAVKATPTPAETAEIARLRASGEEATKKNTELTTKPSPTEADKAQIAEFGVQIRGKQALMGRLEADYQQQLQDMQRDLREKTLDRVNETVRGLAAKGGYTVVFTTNSAVYAANDLTADAMKALK